MYSLRVWASYGLVEYVTLAFLTWLAGLGVGYVEPHWGASIALFGLYCLIGAVAGAAIGFLAPTKGERLPRLAERLALSTLVLCYALHLVFGSGLHVAHLAMLAICALLLLGLWIGPALVAITASSRDPLAAFVNPWTTVLVLVGLPFIAFEAYPDLPQYQRLSMALIYLGSVVGGTLIVGPISRRLRPFRGFAWVLAVGSIYLAGAFLQQTPSLRRPLQDAPISSPDRPNIVLVSLDTVRADHLSIYGYERDTTPRLQGLLSEMTLYRSAIAPSDLTLSSHASMFTGLYATRHGAHRSASAAIGSPLDTGLVTLAERLERGGYYTAGIIANYGYFGDAFNLDQGFDYWDTRTAIPPLAASPDYFLRSSVRNLALRFAPRESSDLSYRRAEEINDHAFELLGRFAKRDMNFFLFLNYMDAHRPYIPPAPFDTKFPGKDPDFDSEVHHSLLDRVMRKEEDLSESDRLHLESQYDGAIAYLDQEVGRLVDELKALGLDDDCILIITSDHGEAFGERHMLGHGLSAYQDQVFVPLLVDLPGASHPRVVSEPVSTIDVFPTILEAAGLEVAEGIDATSLIERGEDETRGLRASSERVVIAESFPWKVAQPWQERFARTQRAIFDGTDKLLISDPPRREFYDLETDPDELRDRSAAAPDRVEELERRLTEWLAQAQSEREGGAELDRQEIERLKALGYVE